MTWKHPLFYKKIGELYKTTYGWSCTCPKKLDLEKNTDIGCGTYINARYGVFIGEAVQIGANCSIYSHDTERGVKGSIRIEKGIKIGANSVILPRDNEVHVIDKNIKAGSVIY